MQRKRRKLSPTHTVGLCNDTECQKQDPQMVKNFVAYLKNITEKNPYVQNKPNTLYTGEHDQNDNIMEIADFKYDSSQLKAATQQECGNNNNCVGKVCRIKGHKSGWILEAYRAPREEGKLPAGRLCLLCWRLNVQDFLDFLNNNHVCVVSEQSDRKKNHKPITIPLVGKNGYASIFISRPRSPKCISWFAYPTVQHLPHLMHWKQGSGGEWLVDQSTLKYRPTKKKNSKSPRSYLFSHSVKTKFDDACFVSR